MKNKNTCGTDCSRDMIQQWFSEGKEIPSELLLSCDTCFKEYVACEAAVVALFPSYSLLADSGSREEIYESLDIAKAESLIGEEKGHELPEFLKNYTNENLTLPEKKDHLLVRISAKGIQVIHSLLDSLRIAETVNLLPSLRSSVDTIPSDHSSVIFEETVSEDQTFYYQLIKENSDDVYLSVKAESGHPGSFKQVNLRKDGRFILSSMVSPDGIASFSGLKAGNYTIEFQGDSQSKSFDLCILIG
jgi:hypothetical protein